MSQSKLKILATPKSVGIHYELWLVRFKSRSMGRAGRRRLVGSAGLSDAGVCEPAPDGVPGQPALARVLQGVPVHRLGGRGGADAAFGVT